MCFDTLPLECLLFFLIRFSARLSSRQRLLLLLLGCRTDPPISINHERPIRTTLRPFHGRAAGRTIVGRFGPPRGSDEILQAGVLGHSGTNI